MGIELIIGVVSVAFLIWWLLSPSSKFKKMGEKMPGPKGYPLVGNALNFPIIGPKAFACILDGRQKYGKVYKIWIGPQLHVVLSDPDDIQMLLSSQTLLRKAQVYKYLHDWLGTGLLVSTGDLWRKRRKAITPTFHFKVLDDFVPIFDKCSDILINCLKEKEGKEAFDISDYISNCALDSVTESAMGVVIDAQLKPKSEYVSAIVRMTKLIGDKISFPWLAVEPLYTTTGRRLEERKKLNVLHGITSKVLEDKKKDLLKDDSVKADDDFGIKKRSAFLELLLKIKEQKSPAFQSDQDIKDEVTTFMFEGHDTTTACLIFTVWLLARHQEVQETLYKEVSSILDSKSELKMEDIQAMKYLDRVLKESMRLYPPVPLYGRRLEQDTTIPSGFTIPAESEVYVAAMIIHRDPEYFPDPETFNPDRFLQDQKHPFAYVPFSAGPRNCIGQKFAMLDMKAIIAKLIYNYQIYSDDNIVLSNELILRNIDGPTARFVKRHHHS